MDMWLYIHLNATLFQGGTRGSRSSIPPGGTLTCTRTTSDFNQLGVITCSPGLCPLFYPVAHLLIPLILQIFKQKRAHNHICLPAATRLTTSAQHKL